MIILWKKLFTWQCMNVFIIMIVKDDCEWNWTFDDKNNYFEKNELIVKNIVMQLIFNENHKIWFFDIQNLFNEIYRKWINLVFWQMIFMNIDSIFANLDINDHMRVKNLNNFEFIIFFDFQSRLNIWFRFDFVAKYV